MVINFSVLTDPSALRQALWQRGCNYMLATQLGEAGEQWSWTDFSKCVFKEKYVLRGAERCHLSYLIRTLTT